MSAKAEPKPSKDVIYIDVDDEITGIIDKVENANQKVVALVLPKRAASLQSIVNMKLLKRSADNADKNVVLITSEQALIPLAGAAGLHVAKNLQSKPDVPVAPLGAAAAAKRLAGDEEPAEDMPEETGEEEMPQKFDYDKPVGALAAKHEAENPETIDLDDDEEKPAKAAGAAKTAKSAKNKVSVPNFDRFRMMLMAGAAALAILIVFIFLAIFVLPKAIITLTTASEPVTANFNLTASDKATLDTDKGTLPAKLESKDQTGTQQVTATGQQNNGDKATGTVNLTAQKCSGNPFDVPSSVPAGTGVSSGGNTYVTQTSTSFHGTGTSGGCFVYAGNSSTSITAQSPGSKYNVSGASFTVAGRSDVSGSGSTSGGSDNIVTVLSQADVDGAKAKITSGSTADQFTKDFEKTLTDQGAYVLTSTLKAGDANVSSSPSVGQPASTANVTVKVTYTVLTVKNDDLKQSVEAKLNSQIDKTKQKLNDNFMDDTTITVQSQSSPTNAFLQVNVDTSAVPIINVASVKKVAEGKKAGEIKVVLNNWPGVKSVDVKLSPFWVSKAPKKPSKIKVILKEDKSTQGNQNSSEP
jgi:hypothetical protein